MPKQRIHDIDLYYETTGHGQPILFIHGLGSSTRDWEKQIDFFARQYQVVTFDVRGHGQSDKPVGPYSIPLFAKDVAALIKTLDLAPAHVVGISMGGMIALQLALWEPDLIKSLTIINTAPEFIVRTMKERLQLLQRQLIVRLLSMRKMGELLSKRLFTKPEQKDLQQQFVERWAENDPKAYLASMQAIIGWSVMEHLQDIKCPTLVVTADKDYTSVADKKEYVAKMINAELVVIKDSHHATPVEKPEQFNEILLAFLTKQS